MYNVGCIKKVLNSSFGCGMKEKQKEDELGARVGTWGWLIAVEDLSNCDLNGQTKNECLSQSDARMSAITPDPSFDIFEIAAAATPSLRHHSGRRRLIKIFVDAAEK